MEQKTTHVWHPYNYSPTLVGSIIFSVIFFVLAVITCYQVMTQYKLYLNEIANTPLNENEARKDEVEVTSFSLRSSDEEKISMKKRINRQFVAFIPLMLANFMEFAGYVSRIVSHFKPDLFSAYIAQTLLLLISPALAAATLYMVFGRMLTNLNAQKYSPIPSKDTTAVFVTGDIISFCMQGGGGGLMSNRKTQHVGSKIVVGGLIVQIIFFGFFSVTEARFLKLISKNPTTMSNDMLDKSLGVLNQQRKYRNWKWLNYSLLAASVLIIIRSVVRVVEFAQGYFGYVISHEVFLYVFDAVPISFVTMILVLCQPAAVMFELERQN